MRNVFVSYSHRLDQDDADEFRERFGNDNMVFHDWSLENQDFGDMKDDTPKRMLVNKNYCQIIDMPETREILVGAIEAAYIVSRNTDPDLSMPLRKRNS